MPSVNDLEGPMATLARKCFGISVRTVDESADKIEQLGEIDEIAIWIEDRFTVQEAYALSDMIREFADQQSAMLNAFVRRAFIAVHRKSDAPK